MNLLKRKFYLERYAKMHNLEGYTLKSLIIMWEIYEKYLIDNKGLDPLIPGIKFKVQESL